MARAALNGKLGDVAFKQGDQVNAARSLEGALRALGRWVPRRRASLLAAALFEAVIQSLHSLAPRLFVARRSLEEAEREFVAIRMYSRLAHVYWFSAGKVPCLWAHLREMNLAERYPPTPELAQAYSEHAPVMTVLSWYGRGLAYAGRSLAIRRRSGRRVGPGAVAELRGHRLVRLLPLSRVHRHLPGIDPPARAHRRALGAEHRHLAPGLRGLPAGRVGRRPRHVA